ncbi:hypothetical protein AGOR_G00000580 [Albula goreensis]|uniref:Uncharacterized protein n=1 Tax=Albula goreensis TaxID=1534307 RepID=A0A8T3E5G7_9TELE|nr:hypothetical protein AGOR_G00000580 [Albula goreensis]
MNHFLRQCIVGLLRHASARAFLIYYLRYGKRADSFGSRTRFWSTEQRCKYTSHEKASPVRLRSAKSHKPPGRVCFESVAF